MPSALSPLSLLLTALKGAPTLTAWSGRGNQPVSSKIFLGSRHMARSNSSPPRIVIFPVEGDVRAPRDYGAWLRDVDRQCVAHLWGLDFDELHELQVRFIEAMDYQASPIPSSASNPAGIFWKTGKETWEDSQDSSKQGEELYMVLTLIHSLDRVAPSVGQVLTTAISTVSTTLTTAMAASDTVAQLASTAGFPAQGYASVDAEQVRYTGLTATSLTGLVRGANGTTPASHIIGAAVAPVQHT